MSVKKYVDPTGYFSKLGLHHTCKIAAGYVPAFITQEKDMIDQLRLSHNVTSCFGKFNPITLELTAKTGVSRFPVAMVESKEEFVCIYNDGTIAWKGASLSDVQVYLASPKKETMRLSIRNL